MARAEERPRAARARKSARAEDPATRWRSPSALRKSRGSRRELPGARFSLHLYRVRRHSGERYAAVNLGGNAGDVTSARGLMVLWSFETETPLGTLPRWRRAQAWLAPCAVGTAGVAGRPNSVTRHRWEERCVRTDLFDFELPEDRIALHPV